jgi:GT2 family glycosyltransferase
LGRAALANHAAGEASGEVLVLLNSDIVVRDSGWLREMVSQAIRPDVGAVGARLLDENEAVQHAGMILGIGGTAGGPGVAGHFGVGTPASALGPFAHVALTRTVSANTGACIAVKRKLFLKVGGFDTSNLPDSFSDVDFCLRLQELGFRNVWTPFAELFCLEPPLRRSDLAGKRRGQASRAYRYMRDRWGPVLDNDPYYNANFSRLDHPQGLAVPARRRSPWYPIDDQSVAKPYREGTIPAFEDASPRRNNVA